MQAALPCSASGPTRPGRVDPTEPLRWRLVFRARAEPVEIGQLCHPDCRPVLSDGVLRRDLRFRPEAGDRLFLEFLVQ